MTGLDLGQLRSVLCIGAHPDDIELGCGGTLLRLLAQNRGVHVDWVVLGAHGDRIAEAEQGAAAFLGGAASREVVLESFRDSFFPFAGEEIKEYFHELAERSRPDLILTHRRDDMHQDHRLVGELTWCAFRDHLILEYEILKYDGDLGRPNVFVTLEEELCTRKVDSIVETFRSQRAKPWFSADAIWSLLRIRGVESHSASRFAEGFVCHKMTV
jgi:LmbE family N-acetylglucosaminyl deacetylase